MEKDILLKELRHIHHFLFEEKHYLLREFNEESYSTHTTNTGTYTKTDSMFDHKKLGCQLGSNPSVEIPGPSPAGRFTVGVSQISEKLFAGSSF